MLVKKNETLVEIGNVLRCQGEDITHEPLPRRWVDLIHHLDELEQMESGTRDQPEANPNVQGST
jgi:hypothetical protein